MGNVKSDFGAVFLMVIWVANQACNKPCRESDYAHAKQPDYGTVFTRFHGNTLEPLEKAPNHPETQPINMARLARLVTKRILSTAFNSNPIGQ